MKNGGVVGRPVLALLFSKYGNLEHGSRGLEFAEGDRHEVWAVLNFFCQHWRDDIVPAVRLWLRWKIFSSLE